MTMLKTWEGVCDYVENMGGGYDYIENMGGGGEISYIENVGGGGMVTLKICRGTNFWCFNIGEGGKKEKRG